MFHRDAHDDGLRRFLHFPPLANGSTGFPFSLDVLASLGVKRVSLGSSLARAAYGAFLQAAREVKQRGTFDFARKAVSYAEINAMFKR